MQDYKKLKVWNRSHLLVLDLYNIVNLFPKEEQFGLVSQIKRAASSIPANIVEGCGRNTNKDFCSIFKYSFRFIE
ncbi:four helix bundle protein [Empedobacter brevis]|uniref:four helix bundle protein n=1 Tax=Empedobacter brevis TaxID=247 RepID=UPI0028AD0C9E|nr:four helix bundle protein [Empedobacter brevis]